MSEKDGNGESMVKVTFWFNFGGSWKKNADGWFFDGTDAELVTEEIKNMTFERIVQEYEFLGFSNPRRIYVHDPDLSFENGLHLIRDENSCREILLLYNVLHWESISFYISCMPSELIHSDAEIERDEERIEIEERVEFEERERVEEIVEFEGREIVEEMVGFEERERVGDRLEDAVIEVEKEVETEVQDRIEPQEILYENPFGYVSEEENETEGSDDDISSDEENVEDENLESANMNFTAGLSAIEQGGQGSFTLGMSFADAKEAREAINLYGVKFGYKLKFVKNESTRLRVVCINDAKCPFLILVSKDGDNGGLCVKTLVANHNCFRQREVPSLSQSFIADYFKDTIYKNPKFTSRDMQNEVKKHLKLHVSEFKCKRAKKVILTQLQGSFTKEFAILGAYIEKLKQSNPGSKCELQLSQEGIEDGKRIFRRIFVMMDACRRNWMAGCRPIISLDGCHLKGVVRSILLIAVGIDANDQIVPIAWAVVNKENKVNWRWFVSWLRQELQLNDGEKVSIVSDMQKGLIDAVKTTLPEAEHRWCARHIYGNWSKKLRGEEMRKRFWNCAWSSFKEEFDINLTKLGAIKQKAAEDLMAYPPKAWSRAFQDSRCSSNMVDSNISESFNSNLLEARQKPIISMLEDIRILAMNRIRDRKNNVASWIGEWSPTAMKLYQEHKEDAIGCRVLWDGASGYEIGDGEDKHTILLDRKMCTCRVWELTGIPCADAIAAMYFSNLNPENMIAKWFHKSKYLECYGHSIMPVPGIKFYRVEAHLPIEPPPNEKSIGRPRKKRIRASNEQRKSARNLSRKGQIQLCSVCKSTGHKKNGCPSLAYEVPNSSQASTARKPTKMLPRKASGRVVGMGVHVDLNTGQTIINPGMPSEKVVIGGEQHDSDPNRRFAIPNERANKRKLRDITFKGDGVRQPGPFPFKPPGLQWKGTPSVTTSQLVDQSIARRKRLGQQKKATTSTSASTTTNV